MSAIRKFTFETEFDASGAIVRDGDGFRTAFTKDEVDTLVMQARSEAGNEVQAALEAQILSQVQAISGQVEAMTARLNSVAQDLRAYFAGVVRASMDQIAGHALAQFPEDQIAGCVEAISSELPAEVALELFVDPAMIEPLRARFASLPGGQALTFRPVADAAPGDIRVTWRDGAFFRNADDIKAMIANAIDRWLAHADDTETQLDLFAMGDAPNTESQIS